MIPATHAGVRYRADVDGLRALAIIAVMTYHAWPSALPGGFAGVDIFFVISGYLITTIILSDLAADRFSFARFYGRRARRIFPALAATLAVTSVAAWLFLLPDEWSQFGVDLATGTGFAANLALAFERAQYFTSETRVLLHLWSLGVEEQFYLLWPLLLFVIRGQSRRTQAALLVTLAGLSFLLNVIFVYRHTVVTFYAPVTRLWELAAGSLLSLRQASRATWTIPRGWRSEIVSFAGLALCAFSFAMIRADVFPGWWALAPVTATVLLLMSPEAWLQRHVLASRAAVGIGLISYPLYLWHWPLLSFARLVTDESTAAAATAVSLVASIALALLTFRYVEQPLRRKPVWSRGLATATGGLVLLLAAGIAVARGVIRCRLTNPALSASAAAPGDREYPYDDNFIIRDHYVVPVLNRGRANTVVFIGDSHMVQYWPRIVVAAASRTAPEVRMLVKSGCAPLRSVLKNDYTEACNAFLDFAVAEAQRPDVRTAVFGGNWPAYYLGVNNAQTKAEMATLTMHIRTLVSRGIRVYVLLSSPQGEAFEPQRITSRWTGTVSATPLPVSRLPANVRTANRAMAEASRRGGAEVIDPVAWLCPGGICPVATDRGPVFRDISHLRPYYVREHAGFIDDIISPPVRRER